VPTWEGFELDLARYELRSDGEPVHLEPQAFDVLAHLVVNRDRVVTKDELLDQVWGDRFVSESALSSRIKAVRRAVGDDGRAQRVIRTVHGRGYQFVAPVSEDRAAGGRPDAPIGYARSGGLNIAYQVTGGGDRDIVLVPGFVSHLLIDWDDPRHAHFLDRLGGMGRLIRFDKRGTGLSDRPGDLPDLETRMDDVRAVMDAVDSEAAVLIGYSEGGPMSVLFAATHPERTRGLVIYGSYARRLRAPDYPWAPTPEERARTAVQIEEEWGGEADLRTMCPTADDAMAAWWGERARAAASPGAARALIEMNSQVDVRSVLPVVGVPTLVLHRRDDRDSDVAEGRYLADHIPGATFVELAGGDHFVAVDPDQILDPVEAFLADLRPQPAARRLLATILVCDLAPAGARDEIEAAGGRWTRASDRGLVAVFDGPARAVRCAQDLLRAAQQPIPAGVHTAEVELRGDEVGGLGVETAARVAALAEPGEVWVSRTVKDLVAGSGLELAPRGIHQLAGLDEPWALYAAT
jgi:pimeloyl-ACP methyl ester carboxylesterase/DNA-binding winged helix-turn-helix (wHTH) protein